MTEPAPADGDPDRLISRRDLATAIDVAPQAISNWRTRHPSFPAAVRRGADLAFSVTELARWLDRRRVTADRLRPGETRGATYGLRFRHALGLPAPVADPVDSTPEGLFVEQVWGVLRSWMSRDDARDTADGRVLALHCMRIVDPDGWRQLTSTTPVTPAAVENARGRLSRPLFQATAVLDDLASDPWRCDRLVRLVDALFTAAPPTTFDYLLDRLAEHRRGGPDEYLMPRRLARLMVAIVDPRPGDRIHDPFCGPGSLLVAAGRHLRETAQETARRTTRGSSRSAVLTGRAATERSRTVATMNIAVHGTAVRMDGDTPAGLGVVDAARRQVDVVLLNPLFGRHEWRLARARPGWQWPYGDPPPHNVAFAWVQVAAEALSPGGRAAVLMPASSTSPAAPSERAILEAMLEKGVVRCLVELPDQLFHETTVPVTVWVLGSARHTGPREVLLIDGRTVATKVTATHRELTEQGCADIVDLYRGKLAGLRLSPLPSGGPVATVAELSEIREHGYDLRPAAYLGNRRLSAVPKPPTDLRGLSELLVRLDTVARAADRELEDRLREVSTWTR